MDLIRLENITKSYRVGDIRTCPSSRAVSLTIRQGRELVAPDGGARAVQAKPRLMNILGLSRTGLPRAAIGSTATKCRRHTTRSTSRSPPTAKLAFVCFFRVSICLARNFGTRQRDHAVGLCGTEKPPTKRPAYFALVNSCQRVGLGKRLDHEPSQMVGAASQQRVAIAPRALINRPPLAI